MQDKDKLLAGKQIELVCRRYPFLFWSSLLASGGLAVTLWQVVERQLWLVVIFALLWAAMAVQFFYSRRYPGAEEHAAAATAKRRAALVLWAAVVGCCWGGAVFAVASSPLEMSVILVMLVLAGVAAFASVTLAAVPFAAEAFLLPAILPGALWMLFYGETLVFFMGAIELVYLGLMLLLSRQTHQMVRSLFLTAEKNIQLLAAQQESDRRNTGLFASFEDCIVFTDVGEDGSLTVASINPAMERLCGKSDAEVRGKRKPDLFPAALGARLEAYERECIASGLPLHCEEALEYPSGKRYFSITKIPMRDETGRVCRVAVIARDITARKQTEHALAVREREFRTLVENAPDPIIRYDRDCRRVYVNKAVEWLGGISAADMIGKTPAEAEWVADDEKARVLQSIRRVLESGRQEEITVRLSAADGGTLHLQHLHVPEFGADGCVESVLSIGRDITSRKYMEEVLRKSEREYRALSENSPDHIVRYDRDCRIRYLNKNFNSELGMPAGYLMGKTLAEIFSNGIFDGYEEILQQVLASGHGAEHFITLHDRGEGARHLHFRFVPEMDAGGAVDGVLAIGRDISGMKCAEEELKLKEFVLDHAHEAAYLIDVDSLRFVYVNEAACRSLGYSRDELLSIPLPAIDPGYTEEDGEELERQLSLSGSFIFESSHRRRDGSVFPVEIQVSVLDYYGRKFNLSLVRDISASKHAEDELRSRFEHIVELNALLEESARTMEEHTVELEASQEQLKQTEVWYRSILQSAPDGLLVADERGFIMLVNGRLEAMFGYAPGELQGSPVEILLPHVLRQKHEGMRTAFMVGDDAYPKAMNTRTVFARHKDGSEFPVDVSLSRLPVVDGMRRAVCALVRDMSEQHAMAAARDAALAEAQRLAQLRSVFMAQMSHELRTPLNGILGYAQNLLQDDALGQKHAAGLQVIRHSGEHLLTLINGILDHAAIEADKFELIPGDIELDAFLGAIIGMIRVRAEQKNLAFICEAAADLPAVVRGDAQRLRQVLLNLLANAVKFTDSGQVMLRVSYTASARMRFEVRDSGVGIAPDLLETIFLPFEQVGEHQRRAGGNGLGLAISRKLVRLMGGDIRVRSQPGAGSTFTFEIGMATVQAEAARVDAAALSGLAATRVAQTTPLMPVPRRELDILHGHAVRGSMRDVIRHADRLADADACYRPFAEQLRLLAGSFQTKALVALIAAYREGTE